MEERFENDPLEEKEKDNAAVNRSVSKQKSLGSSHTLVNTNSQPVAEPLEKKNSRTKSSKNIKNDKSDKSDSSMVPSLSLIKSKQHYDEERERMKSGFSKREIDEGDEKYAGSPELHLIRKNNNTSNENKMVMRNEFSNNMQPTWYLSKETKKSLKKQEKAYKKKRCSCKIFKVDTKACQCNIF